MATDLHGRLPAKEKEINTFLQKCKESRLSPPSADQDLFDSEFKGLQVYLRQAAQKPDKRQSALQELKTTIKTNPAVRDPKTGAPAAMEMMLKLIEAELAGPKKP